MVLFPNCKINLGLNILRKREDGYHDLETVFYPVGLNDALEGIKSADSNRASGVIFSSSGLQVAGQVNDNLCVKAYHLLKKDFPDMPPVQLHLHKIIPMGAGLGGGSSDGAFALRLLNDLCKLNLTQEQLISYALQLGSDCPFFIYNKPCFATGRGEMMQPVELDLTDYRFVLVNPNIHVSTAQAFAKIIPRKPILPVPDIIRQPVHEWKDLLVNDFEKTVNDLHPETATIKQELYRCGALYASMTGSGSTVYGLFEKETPTTFRFNTSYQVFQVK